VLWVVDPVAVTRSRWLHRLWIHLLSSERRCVLIWAVAAAVLFRCSCLGIFLCCQIRKRAQESKDQPILKLCDVVRDESLMKLGRVRALLGVTVVCSL